MVTQNTIPGDPLTDEFGLAPINDDEDYTEALEQDVIATQAYQDYQQTPTAQPESNWPLETFTQSQITDALYREYQRQFPDLEPADILQDPSFQTELNKLVRMVQWFEEDSEESRARLNQVMLGGGAGALTLSTFGVITSPGYGEQQPTGDVDNPDGSPLDATARTIELGGETIEITAWDDFLDTFQQQAENDPKTEFLRTKKEQIEAAFINSGYDDVNLFLQEQVLPIVDQWYYDTLPIGSFDRPVDVVDDALRPWWNQFDAGTSARIRENFLREVQDLMNTRGWTRSQAVNALTNQRRTELANDGLRESIALLDNGDILLDWIEQNGVNLFAFAQRAGANAEGGELSLDAILSEIEAARPDFTAVRNAPVDPATRAAKASLRLNEELLEIRGFDRVPFVVRSVVMSALAEALPLDDPAALEQMLQTFNVQEFAQQVATDYVVSLDERALGQIETTFEGNVFRFLAANLTPEDTYTGGELQRHLDERLSRGAMDDAALNNAVQTKLRPLLENLPDSLNAVLFNAVTQRLAGIAEAEGVDAVSLINSRDLDPIIRASLKDVIGESPLFEEIEILAELNTEGDILALFQQVEGADLTLDEVLEAAADIDPAEVTAGEDDETIENRQRLAELRQQREAREQAEEVEARVQAQQDLFEGSPEGERLALDLQERQREEQRRAVEQTFAVQPFREQARAEIGRFFVGRSANLLEQQVLPDLERAFLNRFRTARAGDTETAAQDIFAQQAPDFFEEQFSRDVLLRRLREAQNANQFFAAGPSRQMATPTFTGGR